MLVLPLEGEIFDGAGEVGKDVCSFREMGCAFCYYYRGQGNGSSGWGTTLAAQRCLPILLDHFCCHMDPPPTCATSFVLTLYSQSPYWCPGPLVYRTHSVRSLNKTTTTKIQLASLKTLLYQIGRS